MCLLWAVDGGWLLHLWPSGAAFATSSMCALCWRFGWCGGGCSSRCCAGRFGGLVCGCRCAVHWLFAGQLLGWLARSRGHRRWLRHVHPSNQTVKASPDMHTHTAHGAAATHAWRPRDPACQMALTLHAVLVCRCGLLNCCSCCSCLLPQ